MAETLDETRARAARIYDALLRAYPDARVTLDFRNDFELLVASILSAQTSDLTTNRVTPRLFERYPTPECLARASHEDVNDIVGDVTYHWTKAGRIIETSQILLDRFGGRVPESFEDLTALPGVGRKIANVVRGNAFGLPAVIVDTHFQRVSRRLGLTEHKDPDKIERDMLTLLPEDRRLRFSNLLLFHGRRVCRSGKPYCPVCPVIKLCFYPHKTTESELRELEASRRLRSA